MKDQGSESTKPNRRQFMKLLTGGSLLCMGCGVFAGAGLWGREKPDNTAKPGKNNFQKDSRMTFEEVFEFAYSQHAYKVQLLLDKLDKGERQIFLERMKQATIESTAREAEDMKRLVNNRTDFASYISEMTEPNDFIRGILNYEIVEHKEKVFEVKITECLTEKMFRKHNALELGYHMFCCRDFFTARHFNPKIKLVRDKTLMQGHGCCNHRWIYEG